MSRRVPISREAHPDTALREEDSVRGGRRLLTRPLMLGLLLLVTLMIHHSFAFGPSVPSHLDKLRETESAHTWVWNHSMTLILLGQKADRDFLAYSWAFRMHHFQVLRGSPVRFSDGAMFLDRKPRPGFAGVLCHSLFTVNCFRRMKQPGDRPTNDDGNNRFYTVLRSSQKINRIAAARRVLTTKDGLCRALQHSHLPAQQLFEFTFPCWGMPRDVAALTTELKRPDTWRRWIVKPMRGSQGAGIRVLAADQVAECMKGNSFRCAGDRGEWSPVIQPYLQDPLLSGGHKWDLRTYVLCTNVVPMRLYLFTEAIVRYAASAYNPDSNNLAVALTNTFVGKALLGKGVAAVTSSFADLAEGLARDSKQATRPSSPIASSGGHRAVTGLLSRRMIGSSTWQAGGATSVGDLHAVLLDAIRLAVGRLFLTAEPALTRAYAQLYSTKTSRGYRCSNCYHLFGVDLIADAQRTMRVIEVRTAPGRATTTHFRCRE